MLTKRIIPCLDVKDGRVVKGINFENLKDEGDPVDLARYYDREGADELVFLDITATHEKRKTIVDLVEKTASQVFIPITVGGGISTVEDMKLILRAGADKISINSAAVRNPELITRGAEKFGSQCIVAAIDAKRRDSGGWEVFISGGRKGTQKSVIDWAARVQELGAGEILLTSMDTDGTRDGYDIELLAKISETVSIPVIASGGAGRPEHLWKAIAEGKADAVLAASIFHERDYSINEVKKYLAEHDIPVRIAEDNQK